MATDENERSRRSFLTTAALGATLGVAGCSGDFSITDDSGSDSESDDEETETENDDDEGIAAAEVSGEYRLEEGDGTDPDDRGLAKPVVFEGESGDTVSITMTSDTFDTYLMLEGPDGDIVAEDDDDAGGLNSQIFWTLEQSGEYTIWCGSFSTTSTGPFTLDVQELDDSTGTASISYGQSQQYILQNDDGVDPRGRGLAKPVTFEGESGDTVTITMTSEFDTYLMLADPDGEVVTEDDDGGFGLNSAITWTLEQSGEYTIWCGSFSTTSTGQFTLELEESAEAGTGNAGSISYGQSQQYFLQEGDGVDPRGRGLAKPVTFLGDSGDTVTISMTSEFDTYLMLADPDGEVVTEDDDGGFGLNSEITWTLEQSGEYTIWCGSFSRDSTGQFTVSLEEGRIDGDGGTQGAEDAESISYGTSRTFRLSEGDGTDPSGDLAKPLNFTGTSGDEVVITMTSDVFDTYLMLTDPDGTVVARNDDYGDSLNSQIRTTLGTSGEYTIWCSSFFGSSTGSFNLSLELQ